jgi:hypothetical protein
VVDGADGRVRGVITTRFLNDKKRDATYSVSFL